MGFEIVRVRLRNTTYCGKTKHLSRLVKSKTYMEGKTETPETELFKYEDDNIVQNPEAIYAQILQVQEKDTVQEIKTATEELSEGLKEIFEKNGLTINEKGVYKTRERCTPKRKKNNHKTVSRRDDGRTSGKQANLLQCGKKALVAENAARCRGICENLQRMPKKQRKEPQAIWKSAK